MHAIVWPLALVFAGSGLFTDSYHGNYEDIGGACWLRKPP